MWTEAGVGLPPRTHNVSVTASRDSDSMVTGDGGIAVDDIRITASGTPLGRDAGLGTKVANGLCILYNVRYLHVISVKRIILSNPKNRFSIKDAIIRRYMYVFAWCFYYLHRSFRLLFLNFSQIK